MLDRKLRLGCSFTPQTDVNFPVYEFPLRSLTKCAHQVFKRVFVGSGIIERGEKVEGLVRIEIATVVEAAGDGREEFETDRVVAFGDYGKPFVLSHGPPCGCLANRNQCGAIRS